MALYVSFTAAHNISQDASGLNILTKRSLSVADNTVCLYEADGYRAILPGANVLLNLNGVTSSRFVLLEADGAFNLRFGAADADPTPVAPISAGQSAVYMATVTGEAALYIENPSSGTSLGIKWAVAGT